MGPLGVRGIRAFRLFVPQGKCFLMVLVQVSGMRELAGANEKSFPRIGERPT